MASDVTVDFGGGLGCAGWAGWFAFPHATTQESRRAYRGSEDMGPPSEVGTEASAFSNIAGRCPPDQGTAEFVTRL